MIGTLNYSKDISLRLGELFEHVNLDEEDFKEVNLLLINWISSSYSGNNKSTISNLVKQTALISKYKKTDTKILIFDGTRSINKKEHEWFIKQRNIFLYEPFIKPRIHFQFLPFTLLNGFSECKEKSVDLICNDISYLTSKDCVLSESPDNYDITRFYLHKYTKKEYEQGYLEDLNEVIKCSCVPLIFKEHRFYYSIFDDFVIRKPDDLRYLIECYRIIDTKIMLMDFFERIDRLMPEFTMEYLSSLIKEKYGTS